MDTPLTCPVRFILLYLQTGIPTLPVIFSSAPDKSVWWLWFSHLSFSHNPAIAFVIPTAINAYAIRITKRITRSSISISIFHPLPPPYKKTGVFVRGFCYARNYLFLSFGNSTLLFWFLTCPITIGALNKMPIIVCWFFCLCFKP